ncbi:hypothetical protein [Ralstonia chuxiongensis]|uniref:Uncharacterized protein n=1 Tax=Ralstonia chuxiongensis TaxID=2957504 RepID=A0AA41WY31_9RALS|nr:hypothetical protein [Ralstonia chuxiongensis]MCP1173645.1 hypothetical protein [Ralstonia chuxiongensis]
MNIQSIITYILVALYGIMLILGIFIITFSAIRAIKSREAIRNKITAKLEANIKLTSDDLVNMGKGLNLNRESVAKCLNQLLADEADAQRFLDIRRLVSEMEKEEPFNDLPGEVKPSLLRLSELADASQVKSDQLVLIPIQKTLASYVELKDEVAKGRKVGRFMNMVAVLGFIIGAWGLYLTAKSPDAKDIDAIVRRAMLSVSTSGINQITKETDSHATLGKAP